jgi:ABC-2 type transport system permease protein
MRFVLTLLSPVLLAFYAAWGSGTRWVELPVPVVPALLVAVLAVIIVVPESFAGERERHTLETLLSTRLTDSSIVYGKMIVALVTAMVLVGVVLILGLVTVNIFHYNGEVLLYTLPNLSFCLAASLIASIMVTAVGILISLRSETIQEATQTLAGAILVPPIVIGMLLLAFREEFVRLIVTMDGRLPAMIIVGTLVGATIALVIAARLRFKRSTLLNG